jgi:hypothetical protein
MTEAKEGFELEWKQAKEECELLEEMISSQKMEGKKTAAQDEQQKFTVEFDFDPFSLLHLLLISREEYARLTGIWEARLKKLKKDPFATFAKLAKVTRNGLELDGFGYNASRPEIQALIGKTVEVVFRPSTEQFLIFDGDKLVATIPAVIDFERNCDPS